MIMIFHMTVRSYPMRKTHLAAWRAWRRLRPRFYSSFVGASSGPGPGDGSEDPSAVSAEKPPHTPVMLKEVLQYLDIQPAQVVLDMTFGGGGHTKAILSTVPEVTVLALDRDPTAISLAQQLAKEHFGRVKPILGRFSELEDLLSNMDVKPGSIDAVLLDAGCSSMQMDEAERGFSLSKDGPLDMRMDGDRYPDMPCAADVVNTLDQQALASILTAYGEERHARKIASAIVEARRVSPITRTQQLASVVAGSFPPAVVYARKDRLNRPAHVATKTFQALRIFVNDELNELHAGLCAAQMLLKPSGRLCVITFHSLEDRLVKRFLRGDDLSNLDHFSQRKQGTKKENLSHEKRDGSVCWLPLRRKVITPEKDDVKENPRGRSSKLRAALRR
ncbi:12S rRNA N(4)-cytidine methyltransferase METTL15 [Oreochromis niloticus]|uniref:12S rRNA N(4)-cytidine methyltransferase METTL15 n=1 Tax=Oreochromis niloticus TaxID=8128 RepID=I3J4E1_ORENI|nr:probable methyltransferase-like protein 15 [Oreochromis niloticus]XP_005466987.1 probable methyltransferase-like protein 15 [Oreochromis niloticus]XP_005466988.1 probable methyltransferase-like protein 15 [Oreochromis niloticus]XP_005466989.1 probable methyltransferase-like protein 15 [Oreochromis niloticus]XP_005466990.1 probable methyltransferase-like protein 15 [Oreochromis niloticus]XP_025761686.1 probable methyltransferase-like protein 15 [Oreochromis niloticus]